ncbi:nicotinate (nicotinamide) nucleotide adenylyltransferase [Piscinibacter sakaiensis]|uniref:Probable nicotinate-nucleotide adenylyltransferase n=1 Tax=Piscinibacter sakaiensis TaxID=1547922 RepID=A0A0K8P3K2_PISS1|nr:nicotinate (nicotinamide) nucleotide adenylyltransferase [Piscinibacter sakaiensis]GAP36805.1 nicotinate-nucleotide adenylyltransferase [Piscinibacter sakaiensis]
MSLAAGPAAAGARCGLYGGSFDPVHRAHLALARSALADLALDQLRWVPAGRPWQKPDRLAPPEDRLAMLRLAVADPDAGDPRFVVDDLEIRRHGPSYTIDTVEALQAAHPGTAWVLLIGEDQWRRLPTWHRWRELLARVTLAVARRPADEAAPAAASEPLPPALADHPVQWLSMPPWPLSATALRQRIAAGRPLDGMVVPAVARYIESRRLYRDAVPPGPNPSGS